MKNFDISRINLYTICCDILINAWVIILAAVTAFVGAFCYFNYLYTPKYTSTMTVSVNLSGYTTNATALSLARTITIADTLDDVFQSEAMREVVKADRGETNIGSITAAQMGDTNLIQVSVTDSSPDRAYETLFSIHNNYSKVTDYVFNNVIIRTLVEPQMPKYPSNGRSPFAMGVVYAFLAGCVIGVAVVIISYRRDTVKSVEDVERELDTRLFGVVERVKNINRKLPQAKRRLIITNPLVGFEFANTFRKMAVKLESLRRTKSAKTFMITSVTENEGKTSCAVNIAVALAQNGHKVLLADCDFKNPSIRRFFDEVERNENSDFHQYIDNGGDLEYFIKHDPKTGVNLLDCMEHCINSADKLASKRFSQTIALLKEQYDFIIIDTPPCGITIDPEIVAGVADASLMVVRQDVVSVTDINDQIQNLSKCYLAGCVFNDFMQFGKMSEDLADGYYAGQGE
jgi:capsular exopolysaccharide synthesis family protein